MQLLQNTTAPQVDTAVRINSQDALGVAGVQMEAGLSSGRLGDANNAAAAAAAAVAVAAPLIKVNLNSDQFSDAAGVTVVKY